MLITEATSERGPIVKYVSKMLFWVVSLFICGSVLICTSSVFERLNFKVTGLQVSDIFYYPYDFSLHCSRGSPSLKGEPLTCSRHIFTNSVSMNLQFFLTKNVLSFFAVTSLLAGK